MEIVLSSVLALILVLILGVKGPFKGAPLFLAATPFGAAAAFNLPAAGGASILVTDIAALTMFVLVLTSKGGMSRIAGSARIGQPGLAMLLLAGFAVIATLVFPTAFKGQTEVFSIARINNETGIVSLPLRPSTGNLTQLFRMMLGAVTFFALATVFRLRPDGGTVLKAIATATLVHVALGWIDVITFFLGVHELLLDPIRSANYAILVEHRMVGLKRMIGGFPEASSFGYFTLGMFAFWLQYWLLTPRSRLATICLILTGVALVRSTSSAAYVATVIFLATFTLISIVLHLRSTVTRRGAKIASGAVVALWMTGLALFAAYEFVQPVTDFLDRALFNKLDGASGQERGSWNAQAFQNYLDTYLMGAGLGSVRASNWLLATMASLGTIGTALFFWFMYGIARLPRPSNDLQRAAVIRGLKAACLAFFISALLTAATPDLGVIFFACAGFAAGLSRGAVVESRSETQRGSRIG